MSEARPKLEFYSLVKTSEELGQQLEYEAISDSLDVPVKQLKRWKTELSKLDDSESIIKLLDVDQLIIDEAADHVAEELEELAGPRMEVVGGVIQIVDENAVAAAVEAKQTIANFKDKVHGLQLLDEEVRGTAGTLVSRIAVLAEGAELNARDLASLTSALTSIQQAFFNKPTTNIQVNTINGAGEGLLSNFRGGLKS